LEITLDKISKTEALIKIRLIEDDYQLKVDEKIKDYAKKSNLKGFRPGKVPMGLIRKMYGKSVLVEEVNHILSHKLYDYIREQELQVLGDPLPDEAQNSSVDWDNQKEFEFQYKLGLAEDFDVAIDKKVKVDTYTIVIDDAVIQETIENLQNQMGGMTNPDKSIAGDSLFGTLVNEEAGIEKDVILEIEKIEKKAHKDFIDKSKDDVITFAIDKAIKDEDYVTQITELDKDAIKAIKSDFNFTVKNVNRTEPAEVNQELFDKTFGKDSVKSLDEFKARIKEVVSQNYAKEETSFEKVAIQNKLVSGNNFEIPEEFLKEWLLKSNEGKVTPEDVDKEFEGYAKELKWSLIKNKIVKNGEIKVENDEVLGEAKILIKGQLAASGMVGDQFESNLDSFADNYLKGENGDNYMKVYNQVMDQKVIDYLKNNITLNSKEVTAKEFREIPLN
jgi:trigger factor